MTEVKEAPKPKTGNGQGQTKQIVPQAPAVPQKVAGSSPFAFMRRFAEEMDRLFEDFGFETGFQMPRFLTRGRERRREAGLVPAEWSPRVDVVQREGQFVVRADLPGMTREDVKVEVTDDVLTIQGERKQEKKEEREGYRYSECSYGSFYRTIPLPEGVDTSKATADFRKGVLEVCMPAAPRPELKARRVEIHEGK